MKLEKLFKMLQGKWSFSRKIKTLDTTTELGMAKGFADFSPLTNDMLAYEEAGIFTTPTGTNFKIGREYIYHYDFENHTITKYFSEDKKEKGLFYSLAFSKSENFFEKARGSHICKKDKYDAFYDFQFEETVENLKKFTLIYEVKGPHKNYQSETTFEKKCTSSL